MDLCNACEHNSQNAGIGTLTDKVMYILNFKKPFCTICKCELTAKASEELEQCSADEPKWLVEEI